MIALPGLTLSSGGVLSGTPTSAGTLSATVLVTDSAGNPFVAVTVSYPFKTIANFPGIPSSPTINRTVQMRVAP